MNHSNRWCSQTLILFVAATLLFSIRAHALEQIIRPYQSVRSAGMGGVLATTGLYDENFYGNPARSAANPHFKLQLPDPVIETTPTTVSVAKDLTGSDVLSKLGDKAGNNLHGRVQMSFPGVYWQSARNSYSIALLTSGQSDIAIRRSYRLDPNVIVDVGPHMTFARKYLPGERLAIGATAHLAYRASTRQNYSLVDFIQGKSFAPASAGGDGAQADFSVGSTYRLPAKFLKWDVDTGLYITNVLGGGFNNLKVNFFKNNQAPVNQPFSVGFGAGLKREELWKLGETMIAFDVLDINNNGKGSLFRLLHIGAETTFLMLKPRLGINQGYLCAGLGVMLRFFELELATYGEEMALNAGGFQDRRIALRLAFQIQ